MPETSLSFSISEYPTLQSQDLYRQIVPPETSQDKNIQHPVIVRVVGATTIELYNTIVSLQDEQLFGFNALLQAAAPASAATLSLYGLNENTTYSAFRRTLSRLQFNLNSVADTDIIGSVGEGLTELFVLNPNVQLQDWRNKAKPTAKVSPTRKMTPQVSQVPLKLSGSPNSQYRPACKLKVYEEHQFKPKDSEAMRRESILSGVLTVYRNHPIVARTLAEEGFDLINANESMSSFKAYLKFIGQFPVLTAEEEVQLFSILEQGFDTYKSITDAEAITEAQQAALISMSVASQKLYFSNLRYVVSKAKPYFKLEILPPLDLAQEGNIGLHKAISRFDFTKGYKFSTYSGWWIKQSVARSIPNYGRMIRLPVQAHGNYVAIRRAESRLAATLNRDVTVQDLVEATGLDEDTIILLQTMGRSPLSIHQPLNNADERTIEEILATKSYEDPTSDFLESETKVSEIFNSDRLTEHERLVLALRFGFRERLPAGLDLPVQQEESKAVELSQQQIAQILGVSWHSIREAETNALQKAAAILQNE